MANKKNKIIAAVALIGLTMMAMTVQAAEQLRIATLAPKNSSYHKALLEVAEAWRKTQGNDAKTAVFTDGSQGGEGDILRKMRIGQLQGGFVSMNGLREVTPEAAALMTMPLSFKSWEDVDFVREKMHVELERKAAERGFIVLAWADGGWIRFMSKEPAAHPNDFKKMKIYAWAGDSDQIEIMKKVGYNPVPLELADLVPALQTGMIDALPTTAYYAVAAQMGKTAPYLLDVHWAPLMGALVVTKKAWESTSPAGREALTKAGAAAGVKIRQQARAEDAEALDTLRKAGVKITIPNAEQTKAWAEFAVESKRFIRGKMVPAEAFDKVEALLKNR